MLVVAAALAAVAALVHVGIFVLETVRWEHPATRRIFGISAEDARITRPLAANQGVYNLMLAIVVAVGISLLWPIEAAGIALVLAGTGSMLCAAVYLVATDSSKLRAAAVQGTVPAVAVVATIVAALV